MKVDQPFDPGNEAYVNLATYRKDGWEVRTPVWLAQVNDEYYVFSESKAGKVKRIRNNGRMSIAACNVRGDVKSEWLHGSARLVEDSREISSMYRAFDKKYGWQMRTLNFFARLSGRYNNRMIIALSIE